MDSARPIAQRPLLALVLRLAAIFVLAIMLVLVKLADQSGLHLVEIMFWRQLPTVPLLIGWFAWRGQLSHLRSDRIGSHAKRSFYGLAAMTLNFLSVTLLPLAVATTLNYSSAIWAVILSALLLREKIGVWRWSAVAAGFAGIVIIAQPGGNHFPLYGSLVAIAAAIMIALVSVQIRDLGRTERPLTTVFYFALFSLPVLALGLPFTATAHSPYQWGLLGTLGLLGLLTQFLLTASLRLGAIGSVIVMDYSGLIWATLFGWLVFDNLPPAATWIGAPLVIGAGLLIAWREHRARLVTGTA